jgi:uncharacterized protein (TIGR02598 family)
MKIPSANQGTRRDAFSLVEVVLAVGVAGFALVALMGLLPTGLKTFRGTMNTAVGSQIAERVFNDMQVSDWANITNETTRYFDDQGTELTDPKSVRCIYWVRISPISTVTRGRSTQITGSTSTNLVTLTVTVANNPGGANMNRTALFSPTNPNTMTFSGLVGRKR